MLLILLDSNRSGIKPGALQSAWPRSVRFPRSGPSVIPPTTPWQTVTATTRPSDPGPRTRRTALEERRGRRARDPVLGPLAQQRMPLRLPRRRATSRVRAGVLRYATDRPTPSRNPIARASNRPRAGHPRNEALPSASRLLQIQSGGHNLPPVLAQRLAPNCSAGRSLRCAKTRGGPDANFRHPNRRLGIQRLAKATP